LNEITFEQVVDLHDKILAVSSGRYGIREEGLIKSAINRPFYGTASGREFYPDCFLKSAALTQSLCLNSGFEDGNKRTGLAAGMLFLFRNGYYIPHPEVEVATAFVLAIVDKDHEKRLSIEQIATWFRENARPFQEGYSEDYLRNINLRYTH
jgi:death-on-curing protein